MIADNDFGVGVGVGSATHDDANFFSVIALFVFDFDDVDNTGERSARVGVIADGWGGGWSRSRFRSWGRGRFRDTLIAVNRSGVALNASAIWREVLIGIAIGCRIRLAGATVGAANATVNTVFKDRVWHG